MHKKKEYLMDKHCPSPDAYVMEEPFHVMEEVLRLRHQILITPEDTHWEGRRQEQGHPGSLGEWNSRSGGEWVYSSTHGVS